MRKFLFAALILCGKLAFAKKIEALPPVKDFAENSQSFAQDVWALKAANHLRTYITSNEFRENLAMLANEITADDLPIEFVNQWQTMQPTLFDHIHQTSFVERPEGCKADRKPQSMTTVTANNGQPTSQPIQAEICIDYLNLVKNYKLHMSSAIDGAPSFAFRDIVGLLLHEFGRHYGFADEKQGWALAVRMAAMKYWRIFHNIAFSWGEKNMSIFIQDKATEPIYFKLENPISPHCPRIPGVEVFAKVFDRRINNNEMDPDHFEHSSGISIKRYKLNAEEFIPVFVSRDAIRKESENRILATGIWLRFAMMDRRNKANWINEIYSKDCAFSVKAYDSNKNHFTRFQVGITESLPYIGLNSPNFGER